jgi:hypothetical protein
MTEAEWLASAEPKPMLEVVRGKVSERKLRLFALACCARIDALITDPRSRAALEFVERHVEVGVARRKGRATLDKAAHAAWKEAYGRIFTVRGAARASCLVVSTAADAAAATLNVDSFLAASYASSFSTFAVAWGAVAATGGDSSLDLPDALKAPEYQQQALLLRDIVGNPFRHPVVDPAWLAPKGAMVKLARAFYEDRSLAELPILADALEEAGCTDVDILSHCRQPAEHVRGCWVLDLLLGKA